MKKSSILSALLLIIFIVSGTISLAACNTALDPIVGVYAPKDYKASLDEGYLFQEIEFKKDFSVYLGSEIRENVRWHYSKNKKCYELLSTLRTQDNILENYTLKGNVLKMAFASHPTEYVKINRKRVYRSIKPLSGTYVLKTESSIYVNPTDYIGNKLKFSKGFVETWKDNVFHSSYNVELNKWKPSTYSSEQSSEQSSIFCLKDKNDELKGYAKPSAGGLSLSIYIKGGYSGWSGYTDFHEFEYALQSS